MRQKMVSYPYLDIREDIWVFLDDDISINVTAVCGRGKELSAEEFVIRYKGLCDMAFKNREYNRKMVNVDIK